MSLALSVSSLSTQLFPRDFSSLLATGGDFQARSTCHPGKDDTTWEIITEDIIRRPIGFENLPQPYIGDTTIVVERYHSGEGWWASMSCAEVLGHIGSAESERLGLRLINHL